MKNQTLMVGIFTLVAVFISAWVDVGKVPPCTPYDHSMPVIVTATFAAFFLLGYLAGRDQPTANGK